MAVEEPIWVAVEEAIPQFIDEEAPTRPHAEESNPTVLREHIRRLTAGSPYRWSPKNGGWMLCFFCDAEKGDAHAEDCAWVWAKKAVPEVRRR